MWLFTETGFVSAVAKYDEDTIAVRARDRKSLEPISEMYGVEISKSYDADYRYRVLISRENFAEWVARMAMDIDYGNFKNRVAQTRGKEFAHPLSEVWATMFDVEDEEARRFPAGHAGTTMLDWA